jgi:putative ABC transport system ATP-binding protein
MLQLSYAEAISSGARHPNPHIFNDLTTASLTDSDPQPTMIALEGVTKSFCPRDHFSVTAVDGITLHIPEHSITLITGPNGSGKTTLLGIIGCMMRPSAGRVTVSGHDVTRLSEDLLAEMRRTHIGFVFQNRHLIRRATALENVMVPGLPCHHHNGDLRHRARSLLARLDIESKSDIRVERLSGGEQQRVAVARALINDPEIVIADEPTAHLDSVSARSFTRLMFDLLSQQKSLIVASHDPALCRPELYTHVVELRGGRVAGR